MTCKSTKIVLVSICCGFILGRIPVYLSPWLLGEFIDELGFTGRQAGAIISFELIGVATAALVLSLFIRSISTSLTATAGALIACLAHFSSLAIDDFSTLLVIRLIAGFGVGLAIASCAASVAKYSVPEKIFGYVHTVLAIAATLTLFITGYIIDITSYKGLFFMMAILCLIAIPLFRFLSQDKTPINRTNNTLNRKLLVPGIITTLAVFMFAIADIATWAFIERIADRARLSSETTGLILGTGALLSISGALAASKFGLRYGRYLPVSIGLSTAFISIIGLYQSQSATWFATMYFLFSASWYFSLPFILGIAAALDDSGGWVASATSAMYWGMAFAPGLSGIIFDEIGLNAVGYLSAILMLVALVMFIIIIRQLKDRNFT